MIGLERAMATFKMGSAVHGDSLMRDASITARSTSSGGLTPSDWGWALGYFLHLYCFRQFWVTSRQPKRTFQMLVC